MKRIRISSPPPRNLRPAAAATASGGDERRVQRTTEDALHFMRSVRLALDPPKYQEFLDAIRQFQIRSVGVRGLMDRMKVLFHGHPDLKRQFNMFLPAEYNLSLSDDDDHQQ